MTHLEKLHRMDSVESILGSGVYFAGFNRKMLRMLHPKLLTTHVSIHDEFDESKLNVIPI